MAQPQCVRRWAIAAIVAVLAVSVWALTVPHVSMPPVSLLAARPIHSPADSAVHPVLEPVLHAPWLGTVSAPERWIVALLVMLGASAVAMVAGGGVLATLVVALVLVLDAAFGAVLMHAGGLVVATGLAWLASGVAFDDHERVSTARPWFNPPAAILLWSLAVWWHWIAIVTWPIVLVAIGRTLRGPARGAWTVASLALGAAAFCAHFEWMAEEARALSLAPGVPLTWRDALTAAFESPPRIAIDGPPGDFSTNVPALIVSLALVGLLFGNLARWCRGATVISGLVALVVALGWPEWQVEVSRFATWTVAPWAAVGLTWVAAQSGRPAWAPGITCALGAVLLAETAVMGARPLSGRDASRFGDALAFELEARSREGPMVLVVGDTRVDAALASWASTGQGAMFVAPDRDAVAEAVKSGAAVLAAPPARQQLELAGLLFDEAFAIGAPAAFTMSRATGLSQCATVRADRWSQLSGLEYTGRLGLHVPPQIGGEMQLIVGDALPLHVEVATPDGREVPVATDALMAGPGSETPPADYWLDGGLPENGPRVIRRVHVAANPARAQLVSVRLGRRGPRVLARLIGYDTSTRGRVCAAPASRMTLFARDRREEAVSLGNDEVFGTGWYGVEGRGAQMFRWAGTDAVVLLPSALRTGVTVTMEAEAAAGVGHGDAEVPLLTLRVNGLEIASQPMRQGRRQYQWNVPAGVWLAGTNELWWHTSQAVRPADMGATDTRMLALQVSSIVVRR